MDTERFEEARRAVLTAERTPCGIGTLSEKTMHAVLKRYYEPHNENHEIRVGPYVADIVGEEGIIEIQTKQLSRLREKLTVFLEVCPVTVVHPVAQRTKLFWIDRESGEISRSRSTVGIDPRRDIFDELIAVRDFLKNPRLSFRFPLLEVEEYRYLNPTRKNPRQKASRCDRIPAALLGEWEIRSLADLRAYIPKELQPQFSVLDFSKSANCALTTARSMVYLFRSVGIVVQTGKCGRKFLYELSED